MDDLWVYCNGVDGATGAYLRSPMSARDISRVAQGEILPRKRHSAPAKKKAAKAGLKPHINPKNLGHAGWGVIFPYGADPAIREALSELLSHRKKQATEFKESYYREYVGVDAYRPGESKRDFLKRQGVGPGPVNPAKVPYYLLIVADPETIPFRFQYELDVQYAVGRIHFGTLLEYAQYARSVVSAETGQICLPRRAVFFGVANSDDKATAMSTEDLVTPLADSMKKHHPSWAIEAVLRDDARKSRLESLWGGNECPALVFTASHGMSFPQGDPRQLPHNGAILCQDWPGPRTWQKSIPQDFYFASDDIGQEAQPLGLISFHFACYGAGTPRFDGFGPQGLSKREAIPARSFVSSLPQRLLGHPKGGALAVLGHVGTAWNCSFSWQGVSQQTEVFESTMTQLMYGYPVGAATEYLNVRYAELSSDLSNELEEIRRGEPADDLKLCGMWTAHNDARNYTVVGDPAVRLTINHSLPPEASAPFLQQGPELSPAVAGGSCFGAHFVPTFFNLSVPGNYSIAGTGS